MAIIIVKMASKETYKPEVDSKESKREFIFSVNPEMVCVHYWLIDTPRGAFSKGRCKGCGDERDFRNSSDNYLFEGTW